MSNCLFIIDVQKGFINKSTRHIPELVEGLQRRYKHVYVSRFFNKKRSFHRRLINWTRFDKKSDDFCLAFSPSESAVIIDKSVYSCVSSDLVAELKKKKIYQADICGIDTDICVTKSAVDFFENGIKPVVLAAYCASHAGPEAHKYGIKTLERFIGRNQVVV